MAKGNGRTAAVATAPKANGTVKVAEFTPHVGKEATKNCFRFSEVASGSQPPIMNEIYLQRWVFGNEQPQRIKVTIEVVG